MELNEDVCICIDNGESYSDWRVDCCIIMKRSDEENLDWSSVKKEFDARLKNRQHAGGTYRYVDTPESVSIVRDVICDMDIPAKVYEFYSFKSLYM